MSNKRHSSIHSPPLTYEESFKFKGGIEFVKPVKTIVCSKCGKGGGTLVKVGDKYEHQAKCR